MSRTNLPSSRDKLLFTPGPLTTSLSVKQAMLHDAGSWHSDFNSLVAQIRDDLLQLARISRGEGFEVILMQGTGTFGVEAILSSICHPKGKLLILSNGAYGERMAMMAGCLKLNHTVLRFEEDTPVQIRDVEAALAADPHITEVAVVHCETTSGLLNSIGDVGKVVKAAGKTYIVDAISSFAAIPIDIQGCGIDYLVSSANKCIEGVPGFSFVFCRRDALFQTEGFARSLSLDLLSQLKGFDKNGQFRYTPPTHGILAFRQALDELKMEGGIEARGRRYTANQATLASGMQAMGFKSLLEPAVQSCIITSFFSPNTPLFKFVEFYNHLSDAGMIIYPGKLTKADTFRIGSIGRIFPADVEALLAAIQRALHAMKIKTPLES